MRLVVFSHKWCWVDAASPAGYSTDGGFPFQMRALSELFDSTVLVLPLLEPENRSGAITLVGHNLIVKPVTQPGGSGIMRKIAFPAWLVRNLPVLLRTIRRADAVHAPIPGDIGTVGMLLATAFRKPLFVRHCGNWLVQTTAAERFWRWFMERFAGGRSVMLATGGQPEPPSSRNPNVRWIFSTSLTEHELKRYATRRKPPLPHQGRLIIVCRQIEKKGTGEVIKSLPRILEERPHVSLDIVGEGEALEGFKQLAMHLGVSERVTFHGKVDHGMVMQLLQQADLFCYPTASSEGFPKVVLEALASGLPVVTTKVSVLPHLIGTGCGLLLEERTAENITKAVLKCLSCPDCYRGMSQQALETAQQYSLEHWRDTIGARLQAAWGPLRIND